MKRKAVAAIALVGIGVVSFLVLVPMYPTTVRPPCSPVVPNCPHWTLDESTTFLWFRVGALYDRCGGYRLVDGGFSDCGP
jgi:hypothetical protein